MIRILKLIGIGVFAIFIIGCATKKIERSMIVGTYVSTNIKGQGVIKINIDGTYDYYYKSPYGKELRNHNKWNFDYENGKPTITFSRFVFGFPRIGTITPGFWVVEVTKTLGGEIRLYFDRDLNYYFKKERKNKSGPP